MYRYHISMANAWLAHLKKFWSKNKNKMSYSQAMVAAKKTYKPKKVATGGKRKPALKGKGMFDDPDARKYRKTHPDKAIEAGSFYRGRGRFDSPIGIVPEIKVVRNSRSF
jgi:hypothetical protein